MSDTTKPPPTDLPAATLVPAGAPDEHHHEGEEPPPPGHRVMAVIRWVLVLVMAAAALGSLNFYFGWVGGGDRGGAASKTIYYCPMHPGVQQDHPGDCPICSMTLVPKPAGAPAGAAGAPSAGGPSGSSPVPGLVPVTLTPQRQQLMGMRTAKVTRETLAPQLRTVGTVAANEKGLAVIQTRFSGWIEELMVTQTGQKVSRNQVLATVYSPELLQAQQEFLTALKWSSSGAAPPAEGVHGGNLDGLAADARTRLELLGISRTEIDEIEHSGQAMRAVKIRSPVSGYVIDKAVVQGMSVQPGTPLFQVADLSSIWVLADVYEYEIGRVENGQKASLELGAYPGEKFEGKVTFVYPTLDPSTRTMRVRLEFPNKELRLKPGMYGNVYLATEAVESLVVPSEAVVDTGESQYLFVAKDGGHFEPRHVKLGTRSAGKTAILEGVSEGEVVVTTANFLLDSESRLRATIEGEPSATGAPARADFCDASFDKAKFPDKFQQCKACVVHRGMGSMEDDCRAAIAKPWK
jgi:Cu(I)/Ag(I) efflux system membrane fusion protein